MPKKYEEEKVQEMRKAVICYMADRFFRDHSFAELFPTYDIIATSPEVSKVILDMEEEGHRYLRKVLQDLLDEEILKMHQPRAIHIFIGGLDKLKRMLNGSLTGEYVGGKTYQYPVGYGMAGDLDSIARSAEAQED